MRSLPDKLRNKLEKREADDSHRKLMVQDHLVDFSSNDYLGFARSEEMYKKTYEYLEEQQSCKNGSTGSRLLSGNSELSENAEKLVAAYHRSEAALIFNSGYNANLGLLSALPQRNDLVLFDEYVHASIRDGIALSKSRHHKFKHNDLEDLKDNIDRFRKRYPDQNGLIYIITESVFSMDGDSPDLAGLAELCKKEDCHLIVDEAHGFGIFGENGRGLVDELGLTDMVFASIVTYGKALGSHGAAVLGAKDLREYLINFARSFIYTTALSPHAFASIVMGYRNLESKSGELQRVELKHRIAFFKKTLKKLRLENHFIPSSSAVQSCLIPGNVEVKAISTCLKGHNFDVRPILSPTVSKNMERLRFCLHTYNSEEEIDGVLSQLAKSLNEI